MDLKKVPVHFNKDKHRFEMNINGEYAIINYKQQGDVVSLIHTEVPASMEGHGIAANLVEQALQYLEEHQLKLVPLCSYVQHYLQKHPEWNRLVLEE